MDGLQIQLILRLERDEAHVLAPYRFGDRLGVHIVVLVDFTKGFINCATISRTSWLCLRKARPRKWAPEQAPKPISDVGMFAVYASSCCCEKFFRTSTLPAAPSATQVKGRLAQIDANRMYLHIDDPPCHKLPLRSPAPAG
jgi:hypothetical protein